MRADLRGPVGLFNLCVRGCITFVFVFFFCFFLFCIRPVVQVVEYLKKYNPDIICLQEALKHQINDIQEALGHAEFAWIGRGRTDGHDDGEFSPVLYKTSLFTCEDNGTFWLSETPHAPGSRSWDSACPRVCSWAKLRLKSNGHILFVFNTHLDHRSSAARQNGFKLILDQMVCISRGQPHHAIITGDLNEDYRRGTKGFLQQCTSLTEPDMCTLPGKTVVQAKDLAEAPRDPNQKLFTDTFTGFTGSESYYIDYIFVRVGTGLRVLDAAILSGNGEELGGKPQFLSDHRPVWANLLVP